MVESRTSLIYIYIYSGYKRAIIIGALFFNSLVFSETLLHRSFFGLLSLIEIANTCNKAVSVEAASQLA
jgi:hypothetical protein